MNLRDIGVDDFYAGMIAGVCLNARLDLFDCQERFKASSMQTRAYPTNSAEAINMGQYLLPLSH